MRDEMDARLWAEHHEQFSKDMGKLFGMIAEVFRTLVAIEYEAPWKKVGARPRRSRP